MADIEFIEPVIAASTTELGDQVIDPQHPLPSGTPCERCSCPVELDDKFCPACGHPHRVQHSVTADIVEAKHKFFRCEQCGSEVATDPDQRSYVCPFCDSTYVVEFAPTQTGRQRPEFIIGFAVTPEEALAKFRRWMESNSWFCPRDLQAPRVREKLRGVYLPFWSFSMLAESRWTAQIGEYWYRTETYTTTDHKGRTVTRTRRVQETEWWPLSGKHHRYYSGYLVSGSRGLPQQDADRIKPFHLPALKRYEPYFLAGWLSEEYSIDREDALAVSQKESFRCERNNIAAFLPGDTHGDLQAATDFSRIGSDLCLLPVYIFSYRYRDKLYRFLVNGQTGHFAGDKPTSWRRMFFVLAVVGMAVVLLGLLLFGVFAALST